MKWLPLLLLLCAQSAAAVDRGLRDSGGLWRTGRDKEFNLTTISPDDETIDSLIEAVDSAVGTLQSAIDYSEYPVPGAQNAEQDPDYFGGNDYQGNGNSDYNGDYTYVDASQSTTRRPPPSVPTAPTELGGGGQFDDAEEGDYEFDDEGDYDNYNDYDEEYSDEYDENEEDGEIVVEEATAGAVVFNSTVSFPPFQSNIEDLTFASSFSELLSMATLC